MPLCVQTLTGRVEGQVNNDSKKFVEFANVTLHREKYSKLIKDTIADKQRRRLASCFAMVSFNYRFGKSTVAPARRRNGVLEEENRRVQTNG